MKSLLVMVFVPKRESKLDQLMKGTPDVPKGRKGIILFLS